MDGLRYSPDDPHYRLGPVHTFLYVRVGETGDWDLFRFRSLSRKAPSFFSDFFLQFVRNRTIQKRMNEHTETYTVLQNPSRKLCPISDFAKKTCGRRPISDKIGKTERKSGLEIGRGSGPTPVAHGGSGAKAPQLATRPVPWNLRGRKPVELTDVCCSGWDSQGFPGPPCPWDTHYQFSIKTLLSNCKPVSCKLYSIQSIQICIVYNTQIFP